MSSAHTLLPIIRSRTRVHLFVVAIALGGVPTVDAQGLGYGIAGPAGFSGFFGSSSGSIHAAGGGEALFRRRAGIGAEFGVVGNSSSVLLVLSGNGVFHLTPTNASLSPFVTGGYTLMGLGYGEGSFSAWNIGTGVDFWAKERVGVRIEFRDHVRPDVRGNVQYWTFRAGIAFR